MTHQQEIMDSRQHVKMDDLVDHRMRLISLKTIQYIASRIVKTFALTTLISSYSDPPCTNHCNMHVSLILSMFFLFCFSLRCLSR